MTARHAFRSRPVVAVAILAVTALPVPTLSAGPAAAQTMDGRRDQPTPASLTDPSATRRRESDRPIGQVVSPVAITAIVRSDAKGKTTYTNPLDHLPAGDRAGTGGGRSE